MSTDNIPRRIRLDLNTPAELAIRAAVDAVELVGAHPLLTEAVILLGQAREKVADYVDTVGDSTRDICPSCGTDFNEFPEMRHTADECGGPECTCYEIIGGHQMGCAFYGKKI